jgi:hypothetical protein
MKRRQFGFTVKDRTLTPLAERFIECARKIAKPGTESTSMRSRLGQVGRQHK